MVKNLPTNAGSTGLTTSPRGSHRLRGNQAFVAQLLKPEHLKHMLHDKRSHCDEKIKYCNWRGAHPVLTTARQSLCAKKKINKIFKKKEMSRDS